MSEQFYSLITDYCINKQINCLQGNSEFHIAEIAVGDSNGNYYEPQTTQSALINEVWRGNVEKCEWLEDRFYCVATIPADVGGFTIREAGVFDENNNLLVITKFPETIKQNAETGTTKQLTIKIELKLSNKELVKLVINPEIDNIDRIEFNTKLQEKASVDLDNLSELGEAHFLKSEDVYGKYLPLNGGIITGDNGITIETGGDVHKTLIVKATNADINSSDSGGASINITDKNNKVLARFQAWHDQNFRQGAYMFIPPLDGSTAWQAIGIMSNGNTIYTTAPTPPSYSNDNNIATTAFVKNFIANGYITYSWSDGPSGVLMFSNNAKLQWGWSNAHQADGRYVNVTFPLAFYSDISYCIISNSYGALMSNDSSSWVHTRTPGGAVIANARNNMDVFYMAFGF